jgi:hypothetical protein
MVREPNLVYPDPDGRKTRCRSKYCHPKTSILSSKDGINLVKDERVVVKPDNRQKIACLPCQSQDAQEALGVSIMLAHLVHPR